MKNCKRILEYIIRRFRGWNIRLDQEVHSISDDVLGEIETDRKVLKFDLKSEEFWEWLKNSGLNEFQRYPYPHKKLLEFFFSAHILEIKSGDIILDAAGGRSNYLSAIKNTFNPKQLILADHIYGEETEKDDILIIGGDISKIPLSNTSVDKIACHHAFEHFQQNVDIIFIEEISRLLKPKGRAVIIPLFIAKEYIECWNIYRSSKFDNNSKLIVDKTASLPGSDNDGHFARIYSPLVLYSRILNFCKKIGLKWRIVTCTLDGQYLPDMKLNFGAKINRPLRALVLEKK